MKEDFLDALRFLFISFEMVVFLFLIIVYYHYPAIFKPIGQLVTSNDLKVVLTLLGLPIAGLIYGYRMANDLTAPSGMSDEVKNKFFKWDGYSKLRNRVYYVIFMCVMSLIVNIILWILSHRFTVEFIGLIYGISNAVWFTGILSLAVASLSLKAILGGHR